MRNKIKSNDKFNIYSNILAYNKINKMLISIIKHLVERNWNKRLN